MSQMQHYFNRTRKYLPRLSFTVVVVVVLGAAWVGWHCIMPRVMAGEWGGPLVGTVDDPVSSRASSIDLMHAGDLTVVMSEGGMGEYETIRIGPEGRCRYFFPGPVLITAPDGR